MQAARDIRIFPRIQATVLRAIEIEADAMLLAKAIDGVYDSDPKVNPEAKKYDEISIQEVIDRKLDGSRSDRVHHVPGKQNADAGIRTE